MLKEFREFILRGNLVDLAVAVVIGTAFARRRDGARQGPRHAADRCDRRSAGLLRADVHDQRQQVPLRRVHQRRCIAFLIIAAVVLLLRHQARERADGALPARAGGRRQDAPVPRVHQRHPDRGDALRVLHDAGRAGRSRA